VLRVKPVFIESVIVAQAAQAFDIGYLHALREQQNKDLLGVEISLREHWELFSNLQWKALRTAVSMLCCICND